MKRSAKMIDLWPVKCSFRGNKKKKEPEEHLFLEKTSFAVLVQVLTIPNSIYLCLSQTLVVCEAVRREAY